MDVLKAIGKIVERENLDITWAPDYSEPGYSHAPEGIAIANWNPGRHKRIGDILEKVGVEVEWSDEWTTCAHCGKAIRTAPDCYHWTPAFWFDEKTGDSICHQCLREDESWQEDYVATLVNNPRTANIFTWIDLKEFGFECVDAKLQSGWHDGMTDSPDKAFKKYGKPENEVVFQLDEQSQFYITFSVWIRAKAD